MPITPMRPPTRQATVQPITEPPTRAIIARGASTPDDPRNTLADYRERCRKAEGYADLEPVRFPIYGVRNAISRLTFEVQELDDHRDWLPSEDKTFDGLLDQVANEQLGQDVNALIGLAGYHYEVTGKYVVVLTKSRDEQRVDFRVYPESACAFNKPRTGQVTVREVAGGRVSDGSAFIVPEAQVHRCWNPHPRFPGQSTAPLLSAIEPLERYHALARLLKKLTDSRFTMGGGGKLVITDASWHTPSEPNGPDPWDLAMQAIGSVAEDEANLRSLIPPEVHGNLADTTKPYVLDLSPPIEDLTAQMQAALGAIAQTMDMAGLWIESGGAGSANHWNEWLTQEENWKQAVAPVADLGCADFTRILRRLFGLPPTVRIGYDESDVVHGPDKGDSATDGVKIGALGFGAWREANGFDDAQKMQPTERDELVEILSAGKSKDAPPEALTIGAGNVQKVAPAMPPALNAAADDATLTIPRANRVLDRLAEIRRATGVHLRKLADKALERLIADAGGRVVQRARNGKPGTRRAAVLSDAERAVAEGLPLAPYLAAVGLTEQEIIQDAEDHLRDDADAILTSSFARQRQLIDDEPEMDPDWMGDEDRAHAGAGVLASGVAAIAYAALREGPPQAPERGEFTGHVPQSLVSDALGVAEGTRDARLGESDEMPTTYDSGSANLADQLAEQMGWAAKFTWVHGFYGEPDVEFEPHVELDGEEFEDLEADALSIQGYQDGHQEAPDLDWIESETGGFYPGDHPGCTCGLTTEMGEAVEGEAGGGEG